ncbi:MAG: phosphoribosylanthranilate isomerase [Xanthomonadaceae bacterium]|nr:phosphoribosylanthranilate isomerase [Xanthomonadaceae bacterium]
MTRIKCCGMTRVEDALLAARFGADAIGLVFTARSKRQVGLSLARMIRQSLPPMVAAVALFMDDEAALVREVIDVVQPELLQFHGQEDDEWCAQFGRRYVKTIAMGEGAAASARLHAYPRAAGLLLDGHGLGEAGGSGLAFDWSRMPTGLAQPLILAGGLTADNIAGAIRTAQPWAVDVASGIEASPGIKDAAKMAAFIAAVRQVSP